MLDPEHPPELDVVQWLNCRDRPTLAALKGRVVAVEAFQMLCPGCVSHGLPQAQRLAARFRGEEVAVLGLHTVFEHHEAMTPVALAAFLHEYRIGFPVGIDRPQGTGLPATMAAYGMHGTPSLLLFDRAGLLRRHYFGQADDMLVAAEVMGLLAENDAASGERLMRRALVSPGGRGVSSPPILTEGVSSAHPFRRFLAASVRSRRALRRMKPAASFWS